MSFVFPSFLFALFAVSIPIVIHLFNFRRFRKIYFSDIRFLKEVKQQTQNRNRIKHILVLVSRILSVSFLVLAFAQPYIPSDKKANAAGTQAISIYIDNSFSMENVSRNGMLVDEAKKMAREIALSHAQTDLFQILTNDFEGKHQRLTSREEFLDLLDNIKISPSVKTTSEVMARQNDILTRSEARIKKSFIISDFQKSVSDIEKIRDDTNIRTVLLPVPANQQNNLYIDSCWFEAPVHQLNQTEKLNVQIKNLSENSLENIPVKLFINNHQKTPSSFSILPGETKVIQLSFMVREPGIQQGRIEIADYPVTYDDKFYFSFHVAENIYVTSIIPAAGPSLPENRTETRPVESLFGKDSLFIFSVQDESKIDYASLASQNLIIVSGLKSISSGLAQELGRFIQNGGSLVVFPPSEADTASYKTFLSPLGINYYLQADTSDTKIDWINFESEIFNNVFEKQTEKNENLDLPAVFSHYVFSRSSRTHEEPLLKLKNGSSFFSKYPFRKGRVYLSAAPLHTGWSSLVHHALFVPLMYKIAMNSLPPAEPYYLIGSASPIPAVTKASGEIVYRIKGDASDPARRSFEVIPEQRNIDLQAVLFVHDQVKEAGSYDLYAGTEKISGISFNYNRKESDLSRYSPEDLTALYINSGFSNFSLIDAGNEDVTKILADIGQGKKLWKWCIALVLLFLAVETLLLRLWK